jgi:hypothetical protein
VDGAALGFLIVGLRLLEQVILLFRDLVVRPGLREYNSSSSEEEEEVAAAIATTCLGIVAVRCDLLGEYVPTYE